MSRDAAPEMVVWILGNLFKFLRDAFDKSIAWVMNYLKRKQPFSWMIGIPGNKNK